MQPPDFGFRSSQYERPTQPWVCGWASEGWSCPVGPDDDGRCRATFECVPLHQGDRWYCARPESHGGKCGDGPRPDGTCSKAIPKCQPTRSLRAQRGLATFWTSALTLGVVLLFLPAAQGPVLLSPGPLTFEHGVSAKDCTSCHSSVHGGPTALLSAALSTGTKLRDSNLCLSCHQLGDHALQAHSRATEELTVVTERLKQAPTSNTTPLLLRLTGWVAEPPGKGDEPLLCATCHQEHRGNTFNLTDMHNSRCQVCHVVKFSSFTVGHPLFSDYPYERRTRIAFDHSSHIGKHFQDKFKEKAPTACAACHMPDMSGQTMLTRDFETTCAGCHAEQITGAGRAGVKGIPFLRLPGLDQESLEEQEISVGEWPADYNIEYGLTPFMQLLLAGDPDLADDLDVVSEFDDLTDLSDASDEEVEAAARVIWAIKGLFYDIIANGQVAITSRLGAALGPEMSARELTALAGQLPVEVVQAAQRKWLPRLITEVPLHRAGKAVSSATGSRVDGRARKDQERERWAATGGWYRQDSDFALLYRPTGHADTLVRTWLDVSSRLHDRTDVASTQAMFVELSDPKAPGLCMKCHSVDQGDHPLLVNWFAQQPVPHTQSVKRFAHMAHFSVLDDKGCQACHGLNPEAEVMEGFADRDPLTFVSSFKPMTKGMCASCHTQEAAGDSCLLCHNYHVGVIGPTTPKAGITVAAPSPGLGP